MKKLFILFIAVVGFGVSSFAQAPATGTATAQLVTACSIAQGSNPVIKFGNIVVGATGTVTVAGNSSGTRSNSGVTLAGTSSAAASFVITGTVGAAYTVTLPDAAEVKDADNNTMVVNAFSCDVALAGTSAPGTTATSTIGVSGTRTFYVGATLNVTEGSPAGFYGSGGIFNVNVAYN